MLVEEFILLHNWSLKDPVYSLGNCMASPKGEGCETKKRQGKRKGIFSTSKE
jgi:hypothetical protein